MASNQVVGGSNPSGRASISPLSAFRESPLSHHGTVSSQRGAIDASLGVDEINAGGSKIAAKHFAILGDKLNIELWYAPGGRWVALATTTERGGRLQYTLQ